MSLSRNSLRNTRVQRTAQGDEAILCLYVNYRCTTLFGSNNVGTATTTESLNSFPD